MFVVFVLSLYITVLYNSTNVNGRVSNCKKAIGVVKTANVLKGRSKVPLSTVLFSLYISGMH